MSDVLSKHQISLLFFTSTPTIPVETTLMVYQDYQNSFLRPCCLLLTPSPATADMILFKYKPTHVTLLRCTHQWLPITLHATSKILAHPISLLSSSWIHLWRHLHILLSSLSPVPVVHSYQADLRENSPSAPPFTLPVIMAHSLTSFRSLPRDTSTKRLSLTFLSEIESFTLILTLTLAQF